MSEELVGISYDIGGTGARGAVISEQGELKTPVRTVNYQPGRVAEQLAELAATVAKDAGEKGEKIAYGGVGMPAPADYNNGILLVKHKPTLAELYGQDVAKILAVQSELKMYYTNDGSTLTLGAIEAFPNEPRLLVVGLGTGLGSGFASNNKLLTEQDGIRPLWDMPFRDRKFEDFVSRGAIINGYEAAGGEKGLDVKDITERARANDQAAKQSFRLFGEALGEGLATVAKQFFRPTRIVISGKIGIKAYDQFGEITQQVFTRDSGLSEVKFSKTETDNLPLQGAAQYAHEQYLRNQRS